MPPSEFTDPSPHISIGPPQVDIMSSLDTAYQAFLAWLPALTSILKSAFGVLVGLSFPISLFFLIVIIYCVEQLKYIRKREELIYDTRTEPAYQEQEGGDPKLAHQWSSVIRHIESPNENDWKQAILEADMILGDILTAMGYRGESIGEKLKRVSLGDMKSLDDAWEAHKVRNDIAHRPGFSINQYDARQVIARYRKVFEEFYYI